MWSDANQTRSGSGRKYARVWFLTLSTLLWLAPTCRAQDTTLVRLHNLEGGVIHVFEHGGEVFARTARSVYKQSTVDLEVWEEVEEGRNLELPYATINEQGLYGLRLLPLSLTPDPTEVPQMFTPEEAKTISMVSVSNRIYVAKEGRIFEFEADNSYSLTFGKSSVRTILSLPGILLVGSYNGVYINDVRQQNIEFSNGYATHVGDRIFLATDDLYRLELPPVRTIDPIQVGPNAFQLVKPLENEFLGAYRKVLAYDDTTLIALRTRSVELLDSTYASSTLFTGDRLSDLEPYRDGFLVSSEAGRLYWIRNETVIELLSDGTTWHDIEVTGNHILLTGTRGVHAATLSMKGDSLHVDRLVLHASIPFAAMAMVDANGNLWVSSYMGLFMVLGEPFDAESPTVVPIIENIEFNRAAMNIGGQYLRVGSVRGVYTLNTDYIDDIVLPTLVDGIQVRGPALPSSRWLLALLLLVPAAVLFSFRSIRKIRRQQLLMELLRGRTPKSLPLEQMDLADFEQAIRDHAQILSVRDMTDHFETNAMQLNRAFNRLGTTPGKFLKEIKLKIAMEMIQGGRPLQAVQKRTGYSQRYLREELPKSV